MTPPYIKLPLKFLLLLIANLALVLAVFIGFGLGEFFLRIPNGNQLQFYAVLFVAGSLTAIEQTIWDKIHGNS